MVDRLSGLNCVESRGICVKCGVTGSLADGLCVNCWDHRSSDGAFKVRRGLDKVKEIPENWRDMVLLSNGHWIPKAEGRHKSGEYRFCAKCRKIIWSPKVRLDNGRDKPRYCRPCWLKIHSSDTISNETTLHLSVRMDK